MMMLIVVSQKIVAEVMSKGVLDVINIITDKKNIKHKYINDNESFFRCFVRVCEITEAAEIIELIDNAKLLD